MFDGGGPADELEVWVEPKLHIVLSNRRRCSVLPRVLIICSDALQMEGLTITREAS